jgi:hypothetical protein
MAACGDGTSSSGTTGDSSAGVIAGATQNGIGDGSDLNWDAKNCEMVATFTKWKWRKANTFHVDEPSGGDPNISIVVACEILKTSKIKYTTKNYLCVDDKVKIDNKDCPITGITPITDGGVIAGTTQNNVGDGSELNWDAENCEMVATFTKWKWRKANTFHVDEPSGDDPNVSIVVACEILKTSNIKYTTKNYLCVDDKVKIDNKDCPITGITTEFDK